MANNTTTTWRWAGTTDLDWTCGSGPNWLDATGVSVDDYPVGNLPTHNVYFHGSDSVNPVNGGPGIASIFNSLTIDDNYDVEGMILGDGNITVTTLTLNNCINMTAINIGTATNAIFDVANLGILYSNDVITDSLVLNSIYGVWSWMGGVNGIGANCRVDVLGNDAIYVDSINFSVGIWNIFGILYAQAVISNITFSSTNKINVYNTLIIDHTQAPITMDTMGPVNLMTKEARVETPVFFTSAFYVVDRVPKGITGDR